jgi:hypothetical protein
LHKLRLVVGGECMSDVEKVESNKVAEAKLKGTTLNVRSGCGCRSLPSGPSGGARQSIKGMTIFTVARLL